MRETTCPDCGKTYFPGLKHVQCPVNPLGKHDVFEAHQPDIPADHNLDNPNISKPLLDGVGAGTGVNCYPGTPGSCHLDAYIFVDYVSDPWDCLGKQMSMCPNTQRVFLVGSHYALTYHGILTAKGKGTSKIQGLKDGFSYCGKKMTVISYRDGII